MFHPLTEFCTSNSAILEVFHRKLMQQYFYLQDLNSKIAIGAPVYFIVTGGLNLTDPSMQNLLCNGQYCDSDSITNQIYAASRDPSK